MLFREGCAAKTVERETPRSFITIRTAASRFIASRTSPSTRL
jgi:hypothetical protein